MRGTGEPQNPGGLGCITVAGNDVGYTEGGMGRGKKVKVPHGDDLAKRPKPGKGGRGPLRNYPWPD